MQQKKRRARTSCEWYVVLAMLLADEPEFLDEEPPSKRTREVRARPDYAQSAWARMLRAEGVEVPGSKESNLFRRDFRLPYTVFVELVAMVKDLRWFPFTDADLEADDELKDVAGTRCIPLELKVLACLQILGRGNCYRDISQMPYMSESTTCTTFTGCRERPLTYWEKQERCQKENGDWRGYGGEDGTYSFGAKARRK